MKKIILSIIFSILFMSSAQSYNGQTSFTVFGIDVYYEIGSEITSNRNDITEIVTSLNSDGSTKVERFVVVENYYDIDQPSINNPDGQDYDLRVLVTRSYYYYVDNVLIDNTSSYEFFEDQGLDLETIFEDNSVIAETDTSENSIVFNDLINSEGQSVIINVTFDPLNSDDVTELLEENIGAILNSIVVGDNTVRVVYEDADGNEQVVDISKDDLTSLLNNEELEGNSELLESIQNGNITSLSFQVPIAEPVQINTAQTKKKSKIDKFMDKAVEEYKKLNSLGDLMRVVDKHGELYIQIPVYEKDNVKVVLQHKNVRGNEYTGILFVINF